jgi:hypothetical protein
MVHTLDQMVHDGSRSSSSLQDPRSCPIGRDFRVLRSAGQAGHPEGKIQVLSWIGRPHKTDLDDIESNRGGRVEVDMRKATTKAMLHLYLYYSIKNLMWAPGAITTSPSALTLWVRPIGVHLGRAWRAAPKHEKSMAQAQHSPKYFSVGPGLGWGRGPWAGTSTTHLRQTRNDPYKGTKRPIYLLKSHFIPHFHVLYKEHKARDNAS